MPDCTISNEVTKKIMKKNNRNTLVMDQISIGI